MRGQMLWQMLFLKLNIGNRRLENVGRLKGFRFLRDGIGVD
jgi:hypothetical protein